MLVDDYNKLNVGSNLIPVNLQPYTPLVTKADTASGEISRYFVRFVTHTMPSDIVEVSKQTYQSVKANQFYIKVIIRWKIVGKLEDETGLTSDGNPITLYKGVLSSNRDSVLLAEETLVGIKLLISDFRRFWQHL